MAVKTSPNIPPFVRFCTASVPMVFDNSMSYYECLCALTKFLQDDVINVINNNAQQLEGLLEGFTELKNYVDNYFDNLDVQEEINNKLDEMAEGGQLAGIIAQFLEAAPVFAYHTIAEMAAADNLSNGCIARVIGNTSAAAGDGAYYTIRTKTGADDPDGVNLVAIGDTLVGVRVQDATANSLQDQIDELREPTKKYIFVGDSYADGYTPDGTVTPWQNIVKTRLGLSDGQFISTHQGGFGFGRPAQYNYYTLINALANDNDVTDIVIGGSYNDYPYSAADISTGISNVYTLCRSKFPNAKLHIAFIGWSANGEAKTALAATYRDYKDACNVYPDIDFMKNVEFSLHDYFNFFSSDGIHPNTAGQNSIANAITECLLTGSANIELRRGLGFTVDNGTYSGTWQTITTVHNNISSCVWSGAGTVSFNSGSYPTLSGKSELKIATITSGCIVGGNNDWCCCTMPVVEQLSDNSYVSDVLDVIIKNGGLYIRSNLINDAGTNYGTRTIKVIQFNPLNITVDSLLS